MNQKYPDSDVIRIGRKDLDEKMKWILSIACLASLEPPNLGKFTFSFVLPKELYVQWKGEQSDNRLQQQVNSKNTFRPIHSPVTPINRIEVYMTVMCEGRRNS